MKKSIGVLPLKNFMGIIIFTLFFKWKFPPLNNILNKHKIEIKVYD
jgi:hypothetical protein